MVNSRTKGITAEQAVARYFSANLDVDARRSAAGWRSGTGAAPDRGDIDDVPGLCTQVKNLARPITGKLLIDIWREAQAQTVAYVAHTRTSANTLLIVKRAGSADPGRWWCYLASRFYVQVVTGRPQFMTADHLVCVELGDIIDDLRLYVANLKR